MKILIIGASGMVGHVLMNILSRNNINVTGIARRKINDNIVQIDLNLWEDVKKYLSANRFDVIVNCAAVLIKESNFFKSRAIYINSLFPHLLVDLFKDSSTKVIHLSTGGVFSGDEKCYFEDSAVSPGTYYGLTKAIGEFSNDKDLVIRSDFWGPDIKRDGIGLFNWFLNQTDEVNLYESVYFNGISNVELARIMMDLLNYSGIINVGTKELISKGEFLRKINGFNNTNHIIFVPEKKTKKTIFLKNKIKLKNINNYDDMIANVFNYIRNNKEIYNNVYPKFYN